MMQRSMTSTLALASRPVQVQQMVHRMQTAHPHDPPRGGRRKLWDIPGMYHCPVIGTCLEISELRRIAAQTGLQADAPLSDYDMHAVFVSAAGEKSPLSIATQKALQKKYTSAVRRFAKVRDAASLTTLWRESLTTGEVPGALWALMTHALADEQLLTLVYKDVHMLSHQIGASQRADLERLARIRNELTALRARHEKATSCHRRDQEDKVRRIQALENHLRETQTLRTQLAALQEQYNRMEAGQAVTDLRQQVRTLETRLAELGHRHDLVQNEAQIWRQRCEAMEERTARLAQELAARTAEGQVLESLVLQQLTQPCNRYEAADCLACLDLAGGRILCVGGRPALTEHYRALVLRCNGRFEHHDGGLEDSRRRLETKLAAADAVICPTDCVSHDAYYRTKRLCKRHGKPCILLNGSGLSPFARALQSLAQQRTSQHYLPRLR